MDGWMYLFPNDKVFQYLIINVLAMSDVLLGILV